MYMYMYIIDNARENWKEGIICELFQSMKLCLLKL